MSHFGSGRCWLVESLDADADGTYPWSIITLPNQENPYMYGYYPIFGIDVREHAYYLKHQNRRADYVSACLQCANRSVVSHRYDSYLASK
jgi:Fe-Mn family superoxide dismutase